MDCDLTYHNKKMLSLLKFWKETQLNKFSEVHSLTSVYTKYQHKKLRCKKIDKLLMLGFLSEYHRVTIN